MQNSFDAARTSIGGTFGGRMVQNGWNHPGDAFLQDADGYFFYQARTDDMILLSDIGFSLV